MNKSLNGEQMKKAISIIAVLVGLALSQEINLTGTILNQRGNAVPNASVTLLGKNLQDTSNGLGQYEITFIPVATYPKADIRNFRTVQGYSYDAMGCKYASASKFIPLFTVSEVRIVVPFYKISVVLDTLEVTAAGYLTKKVPVEEYIAIMDVVLDDEPMVLNPAENITDSSVTLTWTKSNLDNFLCYTIWINGVGKYVIHGIDTTSYVVTGLAGNTNYTFVIGITDQNLMTTQTNEVTAKTLTKQVVCPAVSDSEFCDERDGQVYKKITLNDGTVIMNQNLNYKPESGNYWIYPDDITFNLGFGIYYDWETALTACPENWHLTNRTELYYISDSKYTKAGYYNNETKKFIDDQGFGYWWSSQEYNNENAYYYYVSSPKNRIKTDGLPIRCIQN